MTATNMTGHRYGQPSHRLTNTLSSPSPQREMLPDTVPQLIQQHSAPVRTSTEEMKAAFDRIDSGIAKYPPIAARVTQPSHANTLIHNHHHTTQHLRLEHMSTISSSGSEILSPFRSPSEDHPVFHHGDELKAPDIPPSPSDIDPNDIPPADLFDGEREATISTLMGPRRPRVVMVCHRLPITCKKNSDGGWDCTFNDVRDFLSNCTILDHEYEVHFVGWPGITPETTEEQDALEDALDQLKHPCHPVFLDHHTRERFHKHFCKAILWPLFHYVTPIRDETFAEVFDDLWMLYRNVNLRYAKKACLATDNEDDARIWVHNYHLLLAPNFIRHEMQHAQIGLFLHITFPTSEVFRTLPTRVEILRGMLASDLIGFHNYEYARHFLSSCKRVLDLDFHTMPKSGTLVVHVSGRDVSLRIGHVSILSERVRDLALSADVNRKCEVWRKKFGNRKVIVALGEYEMIRGTIFILQAYRRFLQENPSWIKEIAFALVIRASDSVTSERLCDEIRSSILRQETAIKKEFGDDSLELFDHLGNEDTIALYRVADVGCFCTFWDGFNVMPYSFTVAQVDIDTPASLILSEFMGCMRSMSGALRVNPLKLDDVAKALQSAVIMTPQERRAAHSRRYNYVMHYTFTRWAEGFLKDLKKAADTERGKQVIPIGFGSSQKWVYLEKNFVRLKEVESLIRSSFQLCKHRILLFDYGGTLADVDEQSNKSTRYHTQSDLIGSATKLPKVLPPRTLRLLDELASDPHTLVCIISGHTKSEIAATFSDNPRLCLAAEKGAFFRWPHTNRWQTNPALQDCSGWQEIALDIIRTYTERTDGSYVQKKDTALVWHYHDTDPDYGDMQAVELERYLRKILNPYFGAVVQRYDHGRILEILPAEINKGTAALAIVKKMADRVGAENLDTQDVFILAVGNDRTDEKMFEAVELTARQLHTEHTFSVTIGIKPTQARFYLTEQREITWLLNMLAGCVRVQKKRNPAGGGSQTPPQTSRRTPKKAPPHTNLGLQQLGAIPPPIQYGGYNMYPIGTGPTVTPGSNAPSTGSQSSFHSHTRSRQRSLSNPAYPRSLSLPHGTAMPNTTSMTTGSVDNLQSLMAAGNKLTYHQFPRFGLAPPRT